MGKVEIIKSALKFLVQKQTEQGSWGFSDDNDDEVSWNEAIEWLKQQPCEDCISREAVIEHICEAKECYKEECKGRTLERCPDLQWVFDLPSVQPQPKRGHWIDQADSIGEYASGCYECDECHEVFWIESGTPQDNEYNFCPHCGADMREVNQSD